MRRTAADPLAPLAGADGTGPEAPPPRVDAPEVQRVGDEIAFTWLSLRVSVSFTALRENSDGIQAEVSVVSGVLGEVHWGRLPLASTRAREDLVRKLDQAAPGLPWRPILERACRDTARLVREGEPARPLVPQLATTEQYLIPKLLLANEINTHFAHGDSGKTLEATALAAAVASGARLPGGLLPASTGPVLFLDWESTRQQHEDRLARLLDGLDATLAHPILYRPMARALADEAPVIRREIARHRVALVVVDSLAPACGAEPESADSLIRCVTALRSFGPVTSLILAHMSKSATETRGAATPYGSVFAFNLSRNVWEIRRADADGSPELVMAFFNRKNNYGPRHPPLGLRFQFHEAGMITLHAHDIGQEPDLAARTSLAYRIQAALAHGAQTAAEIAEAADAPEASVSAKLRALKSKGRVIRLPDLDGRARWGLPA